VSAPWRRFAALPGADRRLLAETALMLVLVRVGLALLPFSALRRFSGREQKGRRARGEREAGTKVAWAVGVIANRLPLRTTCLVRALAAQALLRRRGFHPELRIGVADRGGASTITAHAWLECGAEIVVGGRDDLARYSVLSPAGRR
jgi:hypothetical protein